MKARNEHRVERAENTLNHYKENELQEGGCLGPDDLTDLLTDLRHLCQRDGFNFAKSVYHLC